MPTTLEPVAVDMKWTWVVPSPGQVHITTIGIPGPAGGGGGGGGDLNYLFDVPVPALIWVMTHNFGKYPSVSVFDSTGRLVEGDVQHLSVNQVKITFSAAFAGSVSLN